MEWMEAVLIAVPLIGAGALMIWLGLASRAGRLARNELAGTRTRATLTDDETWEAAQRAGWAWTTASGVLSAGSGVVLLSRPSEVVGAVIVAAGMIGVTALVVVGCVKGHRAALAVLADRQA